jgi:hypothetical protein
MKGKTVAIPQNYKGSWNFSEQFYVNKLDSLEEMNKILETCHLPGLHSEEIKNVNPSCGSQERQKKREWEGVRENKNERKMKGGERERERERSRNVTYILPSPKWSTSSN